MRIGNTKATKILTADIARQVAFITVLSDATVYITKKEYPEVEEYTQHGFPLKLYGVHEVRFYGGSLYAISDTGNTDVRVITY